MKKGRFWKFQEDLTQRIETLKSKTEAIKFNKDSRLFMLMNTWMNLRKANSMKDLGFMLKEISMLFQSFHLIDTLT